MKASEISMAESMTILEDSDEEGDYIEFDIKVKYDAEGILSYDTLVAVLDKRSAILGMKKLKHEFAQKRRRFLRENKMPEYKKTVLLYNATIESKTEDNLKFVLQKVFFLLFVISIPTVESFHRNDRTFAREILAGKRSRIHSRGERILEARPAIMAQVRARLRNLQRNKRIILAATCECKSQHIYRFRR